MTIPIDIRTAREGDFPAIERILDEQEIRHPFLSLDRFQVAIVDGEVAGVAHLESCGKSLFMSAVGVRGRDQGKGVARALLEAIVDSAGKKISLYTRIPRFFRRFGFVGAAPPPEIPPRDIYGCEACSGPDACTCMVRDPHDAQVS